MTGGAEVSVDCITSDVGLARLVEPEDAEFPKMVGITGIAEDCVPLLCVNTTPTAKTSTKIAIPRNIILRRFIRFPHLQQ